jgi:hypothetical protein
MLPSELQTAEDFTVAGFRVKVLEPDDDSDESSCFWVEQRTFCMKLQLANLQISVTVAHWWVSEVPSVDEEKVSWKKAGDETLADLFVRIQKSFKDGSSEMVKDECLRLDDLQSWIERTVGADRLCLQEGENLNEQLVHELRVVEDLNPAIEERGGMEETADRADEDEQAKSLAQHLVYGWPSKAAEPVGILDAGKYAKSHPLEFPMSVGDLHDPQRPRKVTVAEWAQHLLHYRDGRFVRGLRGQRVLWAAVNELLLSEARQRGFAVYRSVRRRVGYGIRGGGLLTKQQLKEMLGHEQSLRILTNQLMTLSRDVRTSPMYWTYEGKKLGATVKHLSWLPPWVINMACADQGREKDS